MNGQKVPGLTPSINMLPKSSWPEPLIFLSLRSFEDLSLRVSLKYKGKFAPPYYKYVSQSRIFFHIPSNFKTDALREIEIFFLGGWKGQSWQDTERRHMFDDWIFVSKYYIFFKMIHYDVLEHILCIMWSHY